MNYNRYCLLNASSNGQLVSTKLLILSGSWEMLHFDRINQLISPWTKWPPFRRRYRQMHFHGLRCNMFLRLWLYKYSYGEQLCLWHVRAVVIFGARFYCLLWSAARIRPGKFRLWRLHAICLLLYTCNVYYMYEKCVVDCVYWLGVQWKFV